jgi:hypothetical protein
VGLNQNRSITSPVSEVVVAVTGDKEPARKGRLDFIDNRLDSATGTMRLRAVFDNPDFDLLLPLTPCLHRQPRWETPMPCGTTCPAVPINVAFASLIVCLDVPTGSVRQASVVEPVGCFPELLFGALRVPGCRVQRFVT